MAAYRRSISIAARVKLFYQHQLHSVAPSLSHVHRHDSDREEINAKFISRNLQARNYIHHRFLGTGNNFCNSPRSGNLVGHWLVSDRSFSSTSDGEGAADFIEFYEDAAVEVVPVVSEVAAAAADSFFPVAAIQHLIDYVHCYTGFNWWASIVVATIVIRCFQIPFYIVELKALSELQIWDTARLLREIKTVLNDMEIVWVDKDGDDPGCEAGAINPLKRILPMVSSDLVSGAIYCSFFFALTEMAEKVSSFNGGGILWFTDLTTPDRVLLFPILMAVTLSYKLKEDAAGVLTPLRLINRHNKNFTGLSIPFLVFFPKALFCHWITSRLFFLAFASVMEKPQVQKFLGLHLTPSASPGKKPKA